MFHNFFHLCSSSRDHDRTSENCSLSSYPTTQITATMHCESRTMTCHSPHYVFLPNSIILTEEWPLLKTTASGMQLWFQVLATCAWRQVSGERGSCACVQYGGCRTCANTSITTPTDHSCLPYTPAGYSTKPSVVTQTTCNKDYEEHYTHLLLFCCSANSVLWLSSLSVQQIYFYFLVKCSDDVHFFMPMDTMIRHN